MDQLTEAVYELHAQLLQTLANPRRLLILDSLRSGEKTVTALEEVLGLPQATISKHLATLRTQGLVTFRREGNMVHYAIASPAIVEACNSIRAIVLERMQLNEELTSHLLSLEAAATVQ